MAAVVHHPLEIIREIAMTLPFTLIAYLPFYPPLILTLRSVLVAFLTKRVSEQNGLRANVLLLVQSDMRYFCSEQVNPHVALCHRHLIIRG